MVLQNEKNCLKNKKRNNKNILRAKVLASFSFGVVCFSLFLFMLLTDPIMMILKYYTQVTNGSFIHEIMLKEIEGIHISAFLFNITNTEEFMSGADQKLKVQEVGPFTYKEFRSNRDIIIDSEAQLLWYTPNIRLEFVPEESIDDPHDVNVTVPNIPMLGLMSKLSEYPYLTRIAFNVLTDQLNSKPVVNVDAYNYLWGYDEPLVSLAHNVFPGMVPFNRMGILDRIYDKNHPNRIEISIADNTRFMLKKINGHTRLQMGDADLETCTQCNTLENVYEGAGYPLEITSDFPLRIFKNGLCRILDMEFNHTGLTSYGAESLVYHFSDSFFSLDNETTNGVITLPDCFFGMPLAFSKAHFLDSDPSLYERIDGIKPDDKYRGWITIDPKLGLMLETVYSLQLNLVVGDVSSNSKASGFSNMVLPIAYLKIEQPPLPEESMVFIRGVYHTGPYIVLGCQLIFLGLTVIMWGHCARVVYCNLKEQEDTNMTFSNNGVILKQVNVNNVEDSLIHPHKQES